MRQKGFVILPLVIIIALIGVVGYLFYQNIQLQKSSVKLLPPSAVPSLNIQKPSPSPSPTGNWKTYINSKYRLSFTYPSSSSIDVDNDMAVFLSGDKTHQIIISFDSLQSSIDSEKNQTFSNFAASTAMQYCAADSTGPNAESFYCDKLIQQIPIQNSYGLTGYKFYLNQIHTRLNGSNTNIIGTTTVGPVLAYDVSKQSNNALRDIEILISPLDNTSTIDLSVLDVIGNSLKFQ